MICVAFFSQILLSLRLIFAPFIYLHVLTHTLDAT